MLATVLFTDICGSTRHAAAMGDRSWRFMLERHDALFRRALDRHRGREVKRTGDGFLATFDGPARAIRCAADVADAVGSIGLQVRAGLHTGELEVMDGDLGGLAVHIAARVHGSRRAERGARLEHREGSRGRVGNRLRGTGRARAARRARRVAAVLRQLKPRYLRADRRVVEPYAPNLSLLTACLLALAAPATASAAVRQVIRGAGFGHGIGMSQYGAYGYALHGQRLQEDPRPLLQGHAHRRRRRRGRCGCSCSPTIPTSAFAARPGSARTRLNPHATYMARESGGGILVTNAAGKRVARVGNGARFTGENPLRLLGSALNYVTSGLYRGAIELRTEGSGITAINELDIDTYLRGVVAGEMPSSWPLEALKTQAVAARTYALATRKTTGLFDQYPDQRSQVYRGVTGESLRSDAAVRATARRIVTYGGEPAVTYYFSTSGGQTENVEFSFVGSLSKPWLVSVSDPYDSASPYHRWQVRTTAAKLDSRARRAGHASRR